MPKLGDDAIRKIKQEGRYKSFVEIGSYSGMALGAVAVLAVGVGVLSGTAKPIGLSEGLELAAFGYIDMALAAGAGYFVGGAAGVIASAATNAVEKVVDFVQDKINNQAKDETATETVAFRIRKIRSNFSPSSPSSGVKLKS